MSKIKRLGKNILSIIVGAIMGLIIGLSYVAFYWIPFEGHKVGLGIIALVVPMFILFGLLGLVTGAVIGFIGYRIWKYSKK